METDWTGLDWTGLNLGRGGKHTLAVCPSLLEEEDSCALSRQEPALVAGDVLVLGGGWRAVGVGVGFDCLCGWAG